MRRARTVGGALWTRRRVWLWAAAITAAMWWWWPEGLPGRGVSCLFTAGVSVAAGLAGSWLVPRAGFAAATAAVSLAAAAALFAAASFTRMCVSDRLQVDVCGVGDAAQWAGVALLAGAAVLLAHLPVTLWRAARAARRRRADTGQAG